MIKPSNQIHQDDNIDFVVSWFKTMNNPEVTADEQKAFQRWLDDDISNREAYDALVETDKFITSNGNDLLEEHYIAELEAEAANQERSHKRRTFMSIAATIVIIITAATSYFIPSAIDEEFYGTAKGEERIVVLADGSKVHLNTNTSVHTTFSDTKRHVTLLKGEAIFDVSHDKDRPFTVDAGKSKVTVLGTKFVIRRYDQGDNILVLRGKVNVDLLNQYIHGEEKTLVKGEQVFGAGNSLITSNSINPDTDLAWREGWLRYEKAPLHEVIDDLNRYLKTKLVIDAGALAELRVTAAFPISTDREVVEAIKVAFNLKSTELEPGVIKLEANTAQ